VEEKLSYKQAGVDIDAADAAKRDMAKSLETADKRILNQHGAFATLLDGVFPECQHPVLVYKTEEPGSKQKLAIQHGRVASIGFDLVNHLVNDIIVMGAKPIAVQDAIICGKLEKEVVTTLVATIAEACRAQGCVLTGGETSEQPGVLDAGIYVLVASIIGVVDQSKIIDGSRVAEGDQVVAVASNGLHTNGYSLVRALMARKPEILERQVDGEPFLDAILRPHTCYYPAFRALFDLPELHGLAHITGGGIQDNLNRILPPNLNASIDRGLIRILPVFKLIREMGAVPDDDMLRTFNLGVGMTLVVTESAVERVRKHLAGKGHNAYVIGQIVPGEKRVAYHGALGW